MSERMTAPDLPTWTVADDGWGDPTIWTDGDHAVATRWGDRIRIDPAFTEQVWQVLTRVLAPDEATVDLVAEALVENSWPVPTAISARDHVECILAALAGTSAQARHTADDTKDDCPSYSEMTGGGES